MLILVVDAVLICSQRKQEALNLVAGMLKSLLGDTIDDMFEIQALATLPSKQGRGYATALMKVVHDMVSCCVALHPNADKRLIRRLYTYRPTSRGEQHM